jgi:hypothetical protein
MSISLNRFVKRPGETIDYDFIFTDWLNARNDTVASFTVQSSEGITVGSTAQSSGVVKVFVSGGTAGQSYKVTATITTEGGRVKQGQIRIRVRG